MPLRDESEITAYGRESWGDFDDRHRRERLRHIIASNQSLQNYATVYCDTEQPMAVRLKARSKLFAAMEV